MPYDIMDYLRRGNIFSGGSSSSSRGGYTMPTFGGSVVNDDEDETTKRRRAMGLDVATRTPNPDSETEKQSSISRTMDEYNKLMSAPSGPSQQNYKNFLDRGAPKEEDFKATKMQKLGAILAGVSTGMRDGGFEGYKASDAILSKPYNDATQKYKLEGNRLAEGAKLEETNYNNKVKTLRDILSDEDKQRNDARAGKLTDAQIKDYESRIADRVGNKDLKGWTRGEDKTTGKTIYTRINPAVPGGIETREGNKTDLTPDEKDTADVKKAGKISNITLGREKALNDYTRPQKTQDELDKEARAEERAIAAAKRTADRTADNSDTPNRRLGERTLAFQTIRETHPELARSIKVDPTTNIITSSDPVVLKMVDDAIAAKKAAKTPVAASPKVDNTAMVKMVDENGKEWDVKPSDVAVALTHKLKKK